MHSKMSTDTQIQSTVTRDIDWARHHLFLLAAVVILVMGSVYGIESLLARRAHDEWVAQKTLLDQMQKQNDQAQKQNEQTQAATKAEVDALTQQNALLLQQNSALAKVISDRDAQLIKDRADVKSLPPTTLATKWGAAANQPAPAIQTNGDFDVPLPLAQASYDALLQVPVLTKDNQDLKGQVQTETQIATNNESMFKNEQKALESEQKAHESDKNTCTQNVNTLNAQIQSERDDHRKKLTFWTTLAFIAGRLIKF